MLPTAWHDDTLVEEMYTKLSEICVNARSKSRTLVVGGDFNAVVGERHLSDNGEFVGSFGLGNRNDRGKQLVEWATSGRLVVANTRLRKASDKQQILEKPIRNRCRRSCDRGFLKQTSVKNRMFVGTSISEAF